MTYILHNAQWFVLLIGALVFFHELGHFLVAKAFDVQVLRFSLGFGPKLVSLRRGETEYVISLLPLGGYVKMAGEEGPAQAGTDAVPPGRALVDKPLWQRTLIVVAGPAANMLLAWVVYVALFVGTHQVGAARLGSVAYNEPAWLSGLRPGDAITSIDGMAMHRWDEVQAAIAERPDAELLIGYRRDGAPATAHVHSGTRRDPDALANAAPRGRLGISLQYVKPVLAVVDDASPAARAGLSNGDWIEAVDGQPVQAWHEVRAKVAAHPGPDPVTLQVRRGQERMTLAVTPTAYPASWPEADVLGKSGEDSRQSSANLAGVHGYTGLVSQEVVVAAVAPDSPAARAGLQVGDRLWAVNVQRGAGPHGPDSVERRPVGVWALDLATVQLDGQTQLAVEVQRGQQFATVTLRLPDVNDEAAQAATGGPLGAEGHEALLASYLMTERTSPFGAAAQATRQVREDVALIAGGIAQMVRGSMPLRNMGGPIMLFVVAEKSAKRGWESFGRAMAMTSVNLGLLNLVPVPVLDGGHLLFFALEAVTRKPPSARLREWAQMAGMALLLALMVLVFRNDVLRFLWGRG